MNTEGSEWQAVLFWKWASPKEVKCRKQILIQCQSYWSLTVNFTLIVLSSASTQKFPTDILCSPAIYPFPNNPRFHHTSPGSFCLPLVLVLLKLPYFPTFVKGRNWDFSLNARESNFSLVVISICNGNFKLTILKKTKCWFDSSE